MYGLYAPTSAHFLQGRKKDIKEDTRSGKDVLALQKYLGADGKLNGNTDKIYRSKVMII